MSFNLECTWTTTSVDGPFVQRHLFLMLCRLCMGNYALIRGTFFTNFVAYLEEQNPWPYLMYPQINNSVHANQTH
jgi:hypothetical protein